MADAATKMGVVLWVVFFIPVFVLAVAHYGFGPLPKWAPLLGLAWGILSAYVASKL